MALQTVLTGLRTNAPYHLGNYIGALLPIVRLVKSPDLGQEYRINLFAPNLHSFTTPIDFQKLWPQTMANLKLFVAAGLPLNNPHVHLYRQSYIPAHCELTWILSNFASFGDLNRMVEFKEKSSRQNFVRVGLFIYPLLMAADILLYDARWVPVGDDQRQHLELCRRLAKIINQKFKKEIFTIPADLKAQQVFLKRLEAPRIRSLKNPLQKMSKSIEDPAGTIMLDDKPDLIAKKIMSATTDNYQLINYDWQKQPGVTNLLCILATLSQQSQEDVNKKWQKTTNYQALKQEVVLVVQKTITKLQADLKTVDDQILENHLIKTEKTLNEKANLKLQLLHQLLGLKK